MNEFKIHLHGGQHVMFENALTDRAAVIAESARHKKKFAPIAAKLAVPSQAGDESVRKAEATVNGLEVELAAATEAVDSIRAFHVKKKLADARQILELTKDEAARARVRAKVAAEEANGEHLHEIGKIMNKLEADIVAEIEKAMKPLLLKWAGVREARGHVCSLSPLPQAIRGWCGV